MRNGGFNLLRRSVRGVFGLVDMAFGSHLRLSDVSLAMSFKKEENLSEGRKRNEYLMQGI